MKDQNVLWQAVRDRTLQVISTDHCNFWFDGGHGPWQEWGQQHNGGNWAEFEQQDPSYRRPGKELGKGNFAKIPNGMPGLEERLMTIWEAGVNTGKLSPSRFVELMATNPAKIFGMYPKKGTLAVGSDADIVVWDPNHKHTLSVETTHSRTNIVYEHGRTASRCRLHRRSSKLVDGASGSAATARSVIHRESHARGSASGFRQQMNVRGVASSVTPLTGEMRRMKFRRSMLAAVL